MGIQNAPQDLQVGSHLSYYLPRTRQRTAQEIAMPPEVFGGGVEYPVDPVVSRTGIEGRGKGAIDEGLDPSRPRDGGNRGKIHQFQCRVGRRLQVDEARIVTKSLSKTFRFGTIHKAHLDAESGEHLPGEPERPAIDLPLKDGVIPVTEKGKEGGRGRRHAGSKNQRRLRPLESGKGSLHGGQSRVPVTRVERVALGLQTNLLFHIGGLERRGQVDGGGPRAVDPLLI